MPIFKTAEEAKRKSPIFLDMIPDAFVVYDRDDFFRQILREMKHRLDELGAKRIYKGRQWYWILKPDYKPGEIIRI